MKVKLEDLQTLGPELCRIRKVLSIPQKDVARIVDISEGMLSGIEKGTRSTKHKTLAAIAAALGYTITCELRISND